MAIQRAQINELLYQALKCEQGGIQNYEAAAIRHWAGALSRAGA